MSSPASIDLEKLLQPLGGEHGCGESLRWDPVYDEIRRARREEDKDAFLESEESTADWPRVLELATGALADRSKDLQLAGWLTEALVEQHGFAGLRDGLRLINGLLDQFWDGLYPELDDGDLEPRVAPLVWLTEEDRGARIPNRLREVALSRRTGDGPVVSYNLWKARYATPKGETEDEGAYARRRNEAEEKARQFEEAAAQESVEFYRTADQDLEECLSELLGLDRRMDEKFERQAPGTSRIRQALEDCRGLVRRVLKDKGGLIEDEEESEAAASAADAAAEGAGGGGAARGPIRSREDALRRLEEVAAYLRRTEPHSPVSYLIQRAVSWSQMSLDQLLLELVEDGAVRGRIDTTLGIRRVETLDS